MNTTPETPVDRAARARKMLEHCRSRRVVSLAHVEGLCIDLDEVAEEHAKLTAERDALAKRVAELEAVEPEMQYRAVGLRVTVGIIEEDVLEGSWDGWQLEQRAVRPGPWEPVSVAKAAAR